MKRTFKNIVSALTFSAFIFIAFGSEEEIYDITSEINHIASDVIDEIERIDLVPVDDKDVEEAIDNMEDEYNEVIEEYEDYYNEEDYYDEEDYYYDDEDYYDYDDEYYDEYDEDYY